MGLVNSTIHHNDFIGFTFAGIHSSDLNIYKVSDGKMYEENMAPSFSDKTVQVGGRNGIYLFGSFYSKKEFSISIAFDNVSEKELNRIRNWGADNKIYPLIFDESPYKYYNVKLASPINLKYVCFDESENYSSMTTDGNIDRRRRIYKGEGTIKFVCYEPFARSTILTQQDLYNVDGDYVRVFISKDGPNNGSTFELPLQSLIGVTQVKLYLSRDWIYTRGDWGAITYDNNGNPAPGQWDYGTDTPSSSYYAYQPQKVRMSTGILGSTINVQSDYQTYLFPIDFNKGFMGTIDKNTLISSGKQVNKPTGNDSSYLEPLRNSLNQQKQTELVQYDPLLKVVYGISTQSQSESKYEQYGCFRVIKNEDDSFNYKQIKVISKSLASWNEDMTKLTITDKNETEVYQSSFETISKLEDKIKSQAFKEEWNNWDQEELNKIFIVEEADNTLLSSQQYSIYFTPNNEQQEYLMECRYNKNDEEYILPIRISVVNSDDKILEGKDIQSIEYFSNKFHSYNEWKNIINLPQEKNEWNNNILKSYNCGDLSMPFIADYEKDDHENGFSDTLRIDDSHFITISELEYKDGDDGVYVDSELRIIRGYTIIDNIKIPNENVYNRYITSGDFFLIPSGDFILSTNLSETARPLIKYEYRYL